MSAHAQPRYDTLENLFLAVAEAVRPPERLTVSQAAEKYRKLNNPGSYIGPWDNSMAAYMVEPMDVLGSTEFTGMVFVGPARCGKSDVIFNWLCHTAICDPADMLIVHMTQATARDWSQKDLRRAFRHSPELGSRVFPGRQNMNVHDVKFLSGMHLTIKWPTINELSGKTVQRQWLLDYDRMPTDVDGEGTPFDLTRKRGQTYGRYAMCAAESSPGHPIDNPRWQADTPHEAPPTKGILSLYNRGDRRRRYWRCVGCGHAFEPDFKLLNYPNSADHLEAAEMATLDCPRCLHAHTHDPGPGQPGKRELDFNGKWIKDNMIWLPDGTVAPMKGRQPIRSDIASFWLKGPVALFTDWKTLVFKYLKAMEEYEKTGSDESLKTTVTTDQGLPFLSPALTGDRLPEDLKDRATEAERGVVPEGVRFLIATVDVQKNMFIVQVHGIGIGGDITIIDRYRLKLSKRTDPEHPDQILWLNPGVYAEDWHVLIEEVIEKTYPLADGSGRHMAIKAIGCDSAGREGVTANAYNFWRYLRYEHPANHHQRFQLLKGAPTPGAPRVRISYPDSERKDRRAGARGEVPILEINSNAVKDQTYAMLERKVPLSGMVNFPSWLEPWWYAELTAENRSAKGWENPKKLRNEAWDLLCYAVAINLSTRLVNIERLDWEKPPGWAKEWDDNDLVFTPEEEERPFMPQKQEIDLASLGEKLG